MKTYTILLVDDEDAVIQVMMKKINWENLGFRVIGYANNGVKAFELVEEFQPDVVMTDIRMPYMDGIALAKNIRMQYPATKILIFTGFDEFEYAKEAIRLEVEDYILKPINAKELTEVFEQLKIKLDQEINEKRNVEALEKYYLDLLPVLQANFYTSLIEGKIKEEEVSKMLLDYQISITGPLFCTLIIYTSFHSMPDQMNPMLLTTSVQKQAKEFFGEKWGAQFFSYHGKTVLLVQLKKESEISEVTDECDRFCRYVKRMIGAETTIGIGEVSDSYVGISKSYSSARAAISYRTIYGTGKAINIKEITPNEFNEPEKSREIEITKLFKAIRLGTEDEITEVIGQYITNILVPTRSMQQYDVDIMELVGRLFGFVNNNGIKIDCLSDDVRTLYDKLLDFDVNELRQWLTDISFMLRNELIHVRSSSTKSFVSKAKDYVCNNFEKDSISLDTVCEVLGVSNSYFSSVFKKETGKSFVAYLTDYRMERAAEMLISTNEKSYNIAKMVGYVDPNYFSYVFKRQFGVAPSKYRTEHLESEEYSS